MEPIETKIVIPAVKAVKVQEKIEQVHVSGVGPDTVFKEVSRGWFMYLVGSWEGLYVGEVKPAFAHGDTVRITFEKVEDAKA